ncbi:MAG: signal peptide peptidase SppA [Flavobacteriales bacterium]|nr:signal peptide peptidase SppA [Flavobacteriales bacterium]|tara:strand:+ start:500 stop:2212 length:1713 start_codon:yes stop_codon:yes gene_type:complete
MKFLKNILSTFIALIIFSVLSFSVLIALVMSSSDQTEIKNNSFLHINLKGNLVDRVSNSELNLSKSTNCGVGLMSIQRAIKNAQNDTLIKGILFEIGDLKGSLANVSSLKRTLEKFKKTGRKVIVHSDGLSQIGYYLASSADSIYMSIMGGVEWKGLSAQIMYFNSMMKTIGIEAEPLRAGKYKSAVEPFIQDSMSKENEHQIKELLDDLWSNINEDVSNERNISLNDLRFAADSLGYLTTIEAHKIGLIDGIKYSDEIRMKLDFIANGKSSLISVESYNETKTNLSFQESKLVVINADGAIVDESSESDISYVKYGKILDKILKDENVEAVVLRINSPGGSALASENLWRKLKLIGNKVPLIISMGNYAASGGYYMASAGDTILAEKNTITGSIGVFGLLFNASELTEKIGVKIEKVKTNEMSDFPSYDRKLSELERKRIQKGIYAVYETFKERVQVGRNLSASKVEKLAQGRVWTGSQALEMGLVDKIGGLEEAVEIAANSAGITNYNLVHLPKEKTTIEIIASQLSAQTKLSLPSPFSNYNYMIQNPGFFQTFSKPQVRLPYVISID